MTERKTETDLSSQQERCHVYWDYENVPIPQGMRVREIRSFLEREIGARRHGKISLEIHCYYPGSVRGHNSRRVRRPSYFQQQEMHLNGIVLVSVECFKPEAVDKRIITDITMDLYHTRGGNRISIALISGDKVCPLTPFMLCLQLILALNYCYTVYFRIFAICFRDYVMHRR